MHNLQYVHRLNDTNIQKNTYSFKKHSPSLTASDNRDDLKRHAFMKITVFDGQRNDQATDEHQHGLLHVHNRSFVGTLENENEHTF